MINTPRIGLLRNEREHALWFPGVPEKSGAEDARTPHASRSTAIQDCRDSVWSAVALAPLFAEASQACEKIEMHPYRPISIVAPRRLR
jgi:hypothetical protein